ncbi:MAG: hypothetical protein GX085_01240 [Firmicutes bacterium]|nr:hypothetical protein [Bacillota bacterium]
MKRTTIIILAFILTLSVGGAVMADDHVAYHTLKVTIPEVTKLELAQAGELIDFGTISSAGTYGEDKLFTLTYRCNKNVKWQLKVSAGSFVGDGQELPVSALNIWIRDGITKNKSFDILNKEAVIDSANETGAKEKTIEFNYELNISPENLYEAYAGEYTNQVTYTLFVY